MGKQKTRKAVAKRFKVTAKGRVKFGRPCKSHLNTCKTRKQKRHLRKSGILSHSFEMNIRKMLKG